MVEFSSEIIKQIKDANDDVQLRTIIESSIQNLEARKGSRFNPKRKFLINMIMALRYVSAEGLPSKASENVTNAIEILESLRDQEYSNLF